MHRLVRRLVVVMLLGVALYGVLVVSRGVEQVSSSFATYAPVTFAAACGLSLVNYALRFLKWEYYLAALDIRGIPKGESALTFLSGFVLTVTPGKVGEVFKSLVLQQTRGVSVAKSAPIVVAERVTDLIGVIVLISIGSTRLPGGALWASIGAALVALLLAVVALPRFAEALIAPLPRLPGFLGRMGERLAPRLLEALASLRVLTTPRRLVWPTLLSVVGWGLEGVGLFWILRGFAADPRLGITVFAYSTATLAGAVVPVPGGLGVTEKLLDEQLVHLGHVAPAVATSGMLLSRLATLWFGVAVGFAALGLLRLRHPALAGPDRELDAGKDVIAGH